MKFISESDDDDEYEASLTKWLTDVDETSHIGFTYWPSEEANVTNLVKKQINADVSWSKYKVEVKRYYGMYI